MRHTPAVRLSPVYLAVVLALVACLGLEALGMGKSQTIPPTDGRAREVRTTDTPCQLASYPTREAWQAHAWQLRRQILASAGLLPMPRKTPLRPRVFGRLERPGYSVEKVYLESRPGFYLCGNLYRPLGKPGPHPAVLCPHGHWQSGRLQDVPECSVPGRCINLARQGYVVFSYDMVGYIDTRQIPHRALGGPREQLWGVSIMGLQLWNSIRALDFLSALPDVDPTRIGCTGASGGGTQTFLLVAVDDRVTVSAPVCMVSAHFQGGCICENGPALRLDTNNLEIAALAAPRPLLLVSATGDWTKNNPTVEYPWIRSIYRLYGVPERVRSVQVDAGHNYNQQSREAVYAWFGRWLLGARQPGRLKEQPFQCEPRPDLLVFTKAPYPGASLTVEKLTESLVAQAQAQLASLWPKDEAGLASFRREYGAALRCALAANLPLAAQVGAELGPLGKTASYSLQPLALGRAGRGERIPALLLTPAHHRGRLGGVVLVHGEGKGAVLGADGSLHPLAARLLEAGRAVLVIDCFGRGEAARDLPAQDQGYFTTYNRTALQEQVQDILTAVAYLGGRPEVAWVALAGIAGAGPECLLARALAPGVAACAVDLEGSNPEDDAAYTKRLYAPLLRRAGDFRTAVALTVPDRLLLYQAGSSFAWAADPYRAAGAARNLVIRPGSVGWEEIAAFLYRPGS